ncbi:hypothetical protein HL658_31625 [Azospirillum sp. RWY-5-1]|uniref:Glycosyltransferase RgtA/B/C/D-like domain-containing protein n=1 Tax=Azospirillum oleiclasticum TaxID=2735135 RepID=A0ABX2TIS4_9PROT|nr:hypothetical protein [Azospirillum oleiclasticum]NYZ17117.1 hypothetical protein [Azospirillum oleiclasticum]NYZ24255.1 hypothetical protein [Azospirillum oleiclasticum]
MVLDVVALFLGSALVFWVPGLTLGGWLAGRGVVDARDAAPLGLLAGGAIGYGGFLAVWAAPAAGVVYGYAVCLAALACLPVLLARRLRRGDRPGLGTALADGWWLWAMLAAGLLYLGILFGHGVVRADLQAILYLFDSPLPPDSVTPFEFAKALIGSDPTLYGAGLTDWVFADRPPLQTGVVVTLWPLGRLSSPEMLYQCAGTMLQVAWVPAVAWTVGALGCDRRCAPYVVLVLALSGVVFFNSVYLWPKLLAAALMLAGTLPLIRAWRERRRLTIAETVQLALGVVLAMLAHGGVMFSVLTLALLLLPFAGRLFGWRRIALGAAVVLVVYAPWAGFQAMSVPPGNRLPKMHLAGQNSRDLRSTTQALKDAYGALTLEAWWDARVRNVTFQVGTADFLHLLSRVTGKWYVGKSETVAVAPSARHRGIDVETLDTSWSTVTGLWRIWQREHLVPAIGIPVIGWLLLAGAAWRRGWRDRHPALLPFAGYTLATFLVWCVLEFHPAWTWITHASFTMVLGTMMVPAIMVHDAGRAVRSAVLALHAAVFAVLWILPLPGGHIRRHHPTMETADPGFVALTAVGLAVLAALWLGSEYGSRRAPRLSPAAAP